MNYVIPLKKYLYIIRLPGRRRRRRWHKAILRNKG